MYGTGGYTSSSLLRERISSSLFFYLIVLIPAGYMFLRHVRRSIRAEKMDWKEGSGWFKKKSSSGITQHSTAHVGGSCESCTYQIEWAATTPDGHPISREFLSSSVHFAFQILDFVALDLSSRSLLLTLQYRQFMFTRWLRINSAVEPAHGSRVCKQNQTLPSLQVAFLNVNSSASTKVFPMLKA